jgi:Family of unknown function (DUF5670)
VLFSFETFTAKSPVQLYLARNHRRAAPCRQRAHRYHDQRAAKQQMCPEEDRFIASQFLSWFPELMMTVWMTSVIFFVFWLLGISDSFTLGGYIHILPLMILVVVMIQLIRNRNDLARTKRRYEGAFQLQKAEEIYRGSRKT